MEIGDRTDPTRRDDVDGRRGQGGAQPVKVGTGQHAVASDLGDNRRGDAHSLEAASNGDLVLATVDGQGAILRVYSKDGAKVKLTASRGTKAIVAGSVTILGKVVGVIRQY